MLDRLGLNIDADLADYDRSAAVAGMVVGGN